MPSAPLNAAAQARMSRALQLTAPTADPVETALGEAPSASNAASSTPQLPAASTGRRVQVNPHRRVLQYDPPRASAVGSSDGDGSSLREPELGPVSADSDVTEARGNGGRAEPDVGNGPTQARELMRDDEVGPPVEDGADAHRNQEASDCADDDMDLGMSMPVEHTDASDGSDEAGTESPVLGARARARGRRGGAHAAGHGAARIAGDLGMSLVTLALMLHPLRLGSEAALAVRKSCSLRPFPPLGRADTSVCVKVDGLSAQFPVTSLSAFSACVDPSMSATFRGYNIPRATRANGIHAVRVLCIHELRLQVYLLATRRLGACVDRFVACMNEGGAQFAKGQQWEVVKHGSGDRARLVRSTRATSGPYAARHALATLLDAVGGTEGVDVLVRGFGQDALVATTYSTDEAELCDIETWLNFLRELNNAGAGLTDKCGVDICTEVASDSGHSLMLARDGEWQDMLPDSVRLFAKHGLFALVDANGVFSARARDQHMEAFPSAPELLRLGTGVNFYTPQLYALPTRRHPALAFLDSVSPQHLGTTTRAVTSAIDEYERKFAEHILDRRSFRAFPLRLEVKQVNVGDFVRALCRGSDDIRAMRDAAVSMAKEVVDSCRSGIVRVPNEGLHTWCTVQHQRLVRLLREVGSAEARQTAGVLYQSLALETALVSSLQLWSSGTNHNVSGWQRHERVLAMVGRAWKGEEVSWVDSQVDEECAFLELPVDLGDSKCGLPTFGFVSKYNRKPTSGPLGTWPRLRSAFVPRRCLSACRRGADIAPCVTQGGWWTSWCCLWQLQKHAARPCRPCSPKPKRISKG